MEPINYDTYENRNKLNVTFGDVTKLVAACRERDTVLETLEISYRARIAELEGDLEAAKHGERVWFKHAEALGERVAELERQNR